MTRSYPNVRGPGGGGLGGCLGVAALLWIFGAALPAVSRAIGWASWLLPVVVFWVLTAAIVMLGRRAER